MVKTDKWRIKGDKNRRYQLDLDISSISFMHHPLFSPEHVIESRLFQMYKKYRYNEKKDIVNTLKQKVDIVFKFIMLVESITILVFIFLTIC